MAVREAGCAFEPPFRRQSLLSLLAWLFPCESPPGSVQHLIMAVNSVQGAKPCWCVHYAVSSLLPLSHTWSSVATPSTGGHWFCNTRATLFVLFSCASFLLQGENGKGFWAPNTGGPPPAPITYGWEIILASLVSVLDTAAPIYFKWEKMLASLSKNMCLFSWLLWGPFYGEHCWMAPQRGF